MLHVNEDTLKAKHTTTRIIQGHWFCLALGSAQVVSLGSRNSSIFKDKHALFRAGEHSKVLFRSWYPKRQGHQEASNRQARCLVWWFWVIWSISNSKTHPSKAQLSLWRWGDRGPGHSTGKEGLPLKLYYPHWAYHQCMIQSVCTFD